MLTKLYNVSGTDFDRATRVPPLARSGLIHTSPAIDVVIHRARTYPQLTPPHPTYPQAAKLSTCCSAPGDLSTAHRLIHRPCGQPVDNPVDNLWICGYVDNLWITCG